MTLLYDDRTIQTIKEVSDIVEIVGENVNLKKAGVNYKGLCPFHSEKTPSFTVNQARSSFHCFGCGEGGDVLAFVMKINNFSFLEAIKQLASRYNIALPEKILSPKEQESASKKKLLHQINSKAAEIYHEYLLHASDAASARNYLEKRLIPQEIIESFQLGFAPEKWNFIEEKLDYSTENLVAAGLIVPNNKGGHYDRFRNRVLFPIVSHAGHHLGLGGRILGDQQPKYLNSPETEVYNKGRTLFGLFQNKQAIRNSKRCLIVEGNFDLLSLVAHGVKEVVAPLGTALTQWHVRAMKGYCQEAVLVFDGDQAGMNAALRAVPLFLSEKLPAQVVVLPKGHDPDTLIIEQGPEKFQEMINSKVSLPEFVFNCLVDKHSLSLEGKGKIVEELQPVIQAIADRDLQRSLFIAHFSQKLGLSPEQLLKNQRKVIGLTEKKESQTKNRQIFFSKTEEQLLSFLIVYPQHLQSLLDAGLMDALPHPSGQVIVNHLIELTANNGQFGPEQLMDLTVGPERSFVSKVLISAPSLGDSELEQEAQEKVQWLQANSFKFTMRSLTKRINEAQQLNDIDLLMGLLAEKSRISDKLKEK